MQKKAEGDTEQNNNLQVKKKVEEGENSEEPDEGNKARTDEGGDRNKDGRSKADDENKALFGGHKVKTQRAYSVSKNNDGSHSYLLVGPRPEEGPRHQRQHSSAVHRCRTFHSTPYRHDG